MAKMTAIAAVLAAVMTGQAARAADKIALQLSGPAQFEFAGYYAALWQGLYRAAGIDVAIRPGSPPPGVESAGPPIDPLRAVSESRAEFGVAPAGTLIISAAQGQPLLLLAPVFQRSGAQIYYRSEDDYASPGALTGAKLGRLPASNILDLELATALRAEGVDLNRIDSVPLQPAEALAALSGRVVDAVPGSAWTLPWLAHEKGLVLKSINPADYRVEFYGDTLFTTTRFAAMQPRLVRRFRAASLAGWNYALAHPDDVAARLLKELPHPPGIADPAGFTRYQESLAGALARYPAITLGHSNPDRWERIEAALVGAHALVRAADPADFVYDPEAAARRRQDLQAFAKLGVALVVAIGVAVLLGWRWRRRRLEATGETAEPAAPQPVVPSAAAKAAPPDAKAAPSTEAKAAPSTEAKAAPAEAKTAPAEVKAAPAAEASAAPGPPPPAEPQMPLPPPDLNAVLGRLERPIRQRLPRGATCRMSLLPLLWRCRAEPPDLRRMVLDLASEAAADLGEGGELVVGTRNYAFDEASLAATPGAQIGEYVRVTVRDSGRGMTEQALDRVFDPDATSRPGVAAAAAALRGQGGFVRIESAEGIGTAVHLYLPRVAPVATSKPGEPAAAAE